MTPPKRCTKCGADVPQGLHICLECGLILSDVEEAVLDKKEESSRIVEARPKSKPGIKNGRLFVIAFVVLTLAGVVIILAGQFGGRVTSYVQPGATADKIASASGLIQMQDDSIELPTAGVQEAEPTTVPTQVTPTRVATDLTPEVTLTVPAVPTRTPAPKQDTPTSMPESFYSHYNLAFTSGTGNSFQVYLMDAENPEDWAVLPLPNGYERANWPTFCGQRLAFDVEDQQFEFPRWVYLYDLEQDNLESLDLPDETIERAIFPSCSPRDDYLGVTVSRSGKWLLNILNLMQKRVIFEFESGDYPLISNLTWSYTQPEFYWMGTRRTGFTDINLTQNFDGDAETSLYAQGRYPALSPDGKSLVSFCGNHFYLCIFDLQTGEKIYQQSIHYARQINDKQVAASAAWSSDGQWIYFSSSLSGNWDIYRMHPDGSDLENLTQGWNTEELMPATR